MKKDFAGVRLLESDFPSLRHACMADNTFPPTYEGWLDLVAEGTRQAVAAGLPVRPYVLTLDDFFRWLFRAEVAPCLAALRAYIIVRRDGALAVTKALEDFRPSQL